MPRKYFWATMLVAFWDQLFGNSTSRCSNAGFSGSPITASRISHSTSSKGWTPGLVKRRSTVSPTSAGLYVLCSDFSHQVLSFKRHSGGTSNPRAWTGWNRRRAGRLRMPRDPVRTAAFRRTADRRPSRARGAPRGRARRCARRRAPRAPSPTAVSIRSTIASMSEAITGRLWAALRSAARSFVRSKRWRSPSRLITCSGSGSRRSKVVNRWPHREHSRRRRTVPPSGARRLSSTRVGDWQPGHTISSILLAMGFSFTAANARYSVFVRKCEMCTAVVARFARLALR